MTISHHKSIRLMLSLALAGLFGVITILSGLGQPAPAAKAAGETCFVSVNTSGTTDYQSADAGAVQTAINAATPGDVLKLAGNCVGVTQTAGLTQTAYIAKNLTLRGGYTTTNWAVSDPDANPTTLSANNLGRVILITGTAGVAVDGLIVRDGLGNAGGELLLGTANSGGGLYVDTNAALSLLNSQVLSNTVISNDEFDGGGGLGNLGTSVISNTTFRYNQSSSGNGGAVGNGLNGRLTINGSTFRENQAGRAGALGNMGWITMTASSFISNTAGGAGAIGNLKLAIAGAPGWMWIENTSFLSHTVTSSGGAIDNDGGEMYLVGATFDSNTAQQGGAIYNNSGSSGLTPTLIISNSTFLRNNANYRDGGAIRNRTGTSQIAGSTFNYNTASRDGGAIKTESTGILVSITNTLIYSNSAVRSGGGIYNNATLTLSRVDIVSNTVQNDGGGLYNDSAGTATVNQSAIAYNDAGSDGGGVENHGQISLNESLVSHNTANQDGAGIEIRDGSVTITATTIAYNIANDDGGGIANTDGKVTLINSTVSHNQGLGNNHNVGGGGLYQDVEAASPELHLIHSTIVSNTSNSGGDGLYLINGTATFTNTLIAHNGTENCGLQGSSSFASGGYNLEDGNTCGLTATTDLTDTTPLLGPLADNDGPAAGSGQGEAIETHALLDGSPAIDVIPAANCAANTDQRGVARPQGDNCDIGAFETALTFSLSLSGGNNQSTQIETAFGQPLRVSLIISGTTIGQAGQVITFTGPGSGASISPTIVTATTDSSGVATATVTANGIAGSYAVTATNSIADNSLTFSLTNTQTVELYELYLPIVLK